MPDEELFRLHAVIDGRVQGVGFRAFVIDVAEILDLTGWVKNLNDGKVEVTAEGPHKKLEKLLDYLNRGPRGSWVSGVQQEWQPGTGEFTDFIVARTSW